MRDIHALDAEGGLLEPEHLLQLEYALVDLAVLLHLGAHLHEYHVGVRARELEEPELLAALRVHDAHLVPRLLGQGLRERFHIRRVSGNGALVAGFERHVRRDLARDKFNIHVPLHEHLPENLELVLFQLAFQAVVAAPAQHAVPVFENHRGGHRAVAAQAQHVHAKARVRHVRLLVDTRGLQRLDGIALLHRGLEIQPVARLLHLGFPLGDQVVALAVQ